MNHDDIAAVKINREAACVCGHHPLLHDLVNHVLTGGPARCEECDCANMKLRPESPSMLTLLDKQGNALP